MAHSLWWCRRALPAKRGAGREKAWSPLAGALALALLGGQGVCFCVSAAADGKTQPLAEFADMGLLALAANADKLGPVSFDATFIYEQLVEEVPTGGALALPSGGTVSVEVAPKSVREVSGCLWGRRSRFDFSSPRSKSGGHSSAFSGDVWRELDHAKRRGTIRAASQLPGVAPLDPRELLSYDVRVTVAEMLKSWRPVKVEEEPEGEFTLTLAAPSGQPFSITFSPRFGLMPLRTILYRSDGSLVRSAEVAYKYVDARESWFVDEVKILNYGRSQLAKAFDRSHAHSAVHVSIDRMQLLDAAMADERLALDFPLDYVVQDHTLAGTRTIGLKEPFAAAESSRMVTYVLFVLPMIVAVVLAVKIRRKGVIQ